MRESENRAGDKLYNLDEINSLINDLNNKNKSTREKAQDTIISNGELVISSLVNALSDPRDRVRWEIVKILDEIHVDWTKHADEQTIKTLIGDLNNKDGRVRVRARNALVSIGGKSVFALTEALKSKEQWTRWEAAKALSEIGDS
ncbi:MAG: HEAT repeat domain-containing protein, partial [Dehalococcoidales bacterium]|nr:HEAT repeat domain-containing protein [Dehalococcoidales bacterium]